MYNMSTMGEITHNIKGLSGNQYLLPAEGGKNAICMLKTQIHVQYGEQTNCVLLLFSQGT